MKISACMICLNEEEFIELSLRSTMDIVDEIIIVDGGSKDRTLDIIDSMETSKIQVYHKKWRGNYGNQRQYALSKAEGDWILQYDCDEVYSDKAYLFKELADKSPNPNFNTHMVHFINDLGHIDSTEDTHQCVNRFFRNFEDVTYSQGMHELPESKYFRDPLFLPEPIVYHLGYLKGMKNIIKKYRENVSKSEVHSREFLDMWRRRHIDGSYPTKPFDPLEIDSKLLKEAFYIE